MDSRPAANGATHNGRWLITLLLLCGALNPIARAQAPSQPPADAAPSQPPADAATSQPPADVATPQAEPPALVPPATPDAPRIDAAPSMRLATPSLPEPAPWRERYERARVALLEERFADAVRDFAQLEQSATTQQERAIAQEFGRLASEELARRAPTDQPEIRTSDELTALYASAVFYGLGTSAWLDLQLKPASFGGAILPFAVFTTAAVGVVALADHYRPMRHGIPHAIAAGLYLGFGEGLWLVGYQNAYAAHHPGISRWGSDRVSSVLWATATAGGVAGALVGALRRPTPGRISFTASSAIWSGVFSAFASQAIDTNSVERHHRAYIVGAVAYNVGLVGGLLFAPTVAPSVARVRFIDLGGLFGAMIGGGAYALISPSRTPRGALGAAAIGGTLGLGAAFWATSGMPADRSHDRLRPVIGQSSSQVFAVQPILMPTRGGAMAGVAGAL